MTVIEEILAARRKFMEVERRLPRKCRLSSLNAARLAEWSADDDGISKQVDGAYVYGMNFYEDFLVDDIELE